MKNHKLKFFYPITSGTKPNPIIKRKYIHSHQSGGLWAEIRDLSQSEISANDAVGKKVSMYARVGYNPVVLEKYKELVVVDERGNAYRIKEKPDEFDYSKGDMRIVLYLYEDTSVYTEDEYV